LAPSYGVQKSDKRTRDEKGDFSVLRERLELSRVAPPDPKSSSQLFLLTERIV